MKADVLIESPSLETFMVMIRARGLVPVTPSELLPVAATVPATWVP